MTKSIQKQLERCDRDRLGAMNLMTFPEFQARCVRLTDTKNVQDVWSVMLNEVPGVGRVGVEGQILSDPRHRTCWGLYHSTAHARGSDRDPQILNSKTKHVLDCLFR